MPRLQRSDLAKEFSDLVKQEIKNHNDTILASAVKINGMVQQLEDMGKASDKNHQTYKNAFLGQKISLEHLEAKFDELIAKMQREHHDVSQQTKLDMKSIMKSFDDRSTYFMTIDGFDGFKKKIDHWSANIQRSFEVQNDVLRQRCEKISDETKQAIEILRAAVQKSIDQEIEDRKDQDVTLDHFAVNFAGMQQEIEKTKKRCFIIEKNIENLYTQIERLKESK
jgi:malonyl CoA-acyl carrier protein transacylase